MIDIEFLTNVLGKIEYWRNSSPEYVAEKMMPYLTPCGGCGARIDKNCRRTKEKCFRAFHGGRFEKIDL